MTKSTFSIAVLSGKGGVGKSNLSLNLGFAFQSFKKGVLLMDCDVGLANIDILLGISPTLFMQNIYLDNTPVKDILIPLVDKDLAPFDLIPANSGISTLSELDTSAQSILCQHINPATTKYDLLMLDISAGITLTALGLSSYTDMRLVVVTPEPTSMTDSYALMKVMTVEYNISSFHILVNQAETAEEAEETYQRLKSVCENFLHFTPEYLGYIPYDPTVPLAVTKQKPFFIDAPDCPAALSCKKAAHTILGVISSFQKSSTAPALCTNNSK